MTRRSGPGVASRLASMPLVLAAPRRGAPRRIAFGLAGALALAAAFALGAAAAPWAGIRPAGPLPAQAAALAGLQQARQMLEQVKLQQRVSSARGQELERQIDALNQALRQCQVDLAFFRGARGARDGRDAHRRPDPRP